MDESACDRLIREAMERGEFDDLPGAGKPIPGRGEPYAPNWWVKSFVERERSDDERRARYGQIEARLIDAGSCRFQAFDVEDVVASWKSVVRARSRRAGDR
jgi:hypothetical protein